MKRHIIIYTILIILSVILLYLMVHSTKDYNLTDYIDYVNHYPCDIMVQPIHNSTEAKKNAIIVWNTVYATNHKKTTDIVAYYDKNSHTWLLHKKIGPLFNGGKIEFGGSPYIIIDGESGRVLAVWHTK